MLSVDPMNGEVFQAFKALDGVSWLAAAIADFDRDGIPDVAVSRTDDDADGPAQGIEVTGPELPLLTRALTSGDYDGDGVDDVIVGGDELYVVVRGEPAKP